MNNQWAFIMLFLFLREDDDSDPLTIRPDRILIKPARQDGKTGPTIVANNIQNTLESSFSKASIPMANRDASLKNLTFHRIGKIHGSIRTMPPPKCPIMSRNSCTRSHIPHSPPSASTPP